MWKNLGMVVVVLSVYLSGCAGTDGQGDQHRQDGGAHGEQTGDEDTDSSSSSSGNDGTGGSNEGSSSSGNGDGDNVGDGDSDSDAGGDGDEPEQPIIPSQVAGPSREEGKLPLYVFFNGVEALKGLLEMGDEEQPEFLNYTFHWDFDAGIGSNPETRHKHAVGFNVGHVFEEARPYLTTLTIFDENGDLIEDPDEVLRWTIVPSEFDGDTIYVAENGSDQGDGSIDNPLKSVVRAFDRAQPNTRILLRRGDTFQMDGVVVVDRPGPVIIEPYDNPEDENAPAPVIHTNDQDNDYSIFNIESSDWRIQGIHFTGLGQTTGVSGPRNSGGIQMLQSSSNNLIIDCIFEELATIVLYIVGDANAVFDSDIRQFGNYAFYLQDEAAQRISIVGNRVYDMGGDFFEHVLRLQLGNYVFIGENHFEATRAKSNIQVRGNSGHVVVWSNVLDRVSGFRPQHDQAEERVHHCIFDSNLVLGRTSAEFENQEYLIRQDALRVAAKDIVIRNNVFLNYRAPIVFDEHPLVGVPERVDLYNNSFLCDTSSCVGIEVVEESKDIRVFNNLFGSINATPSGVTTLRWKGPEASLVDLQSDYNFSFMPGSTGGAVRYEVSGSLRSLASWQSSTGQDAHSSDAVQPVFATLAFVEGLTEVPVGGAAQQGQLQFVSDFGKGSYWQPAATQFNSLSEESDVPVTPALDMYMRERSKGSGSKVTAGAVEAAL